MQRLSLPDLDATHRLAQALASLARPGDAILLEGPLGAGKSEFARAFLRAAAGDEALEVPSPTFTLVQSYETRLGVVHHFDLWRLEGPAGMTELGWDDARAGIVLVEWPDRLGALRPVDALTLRLEWREGEAREAELCGWEERFGAEGRDALIAGFLAGCGYRAARSEPMAPDAGLRRYFRLAGGPRPAVLMDAPPPADVRPFLRIAAHLAGIGLSVPAIIAADPHAGLVLEEDFGRSLLSDRPEPALFDVAVDTLIALQRAVFPLPLREGESFLPAWDPTEMRDTALGTLFDWWWPAVFHAPAPAAAREDVAAALTAMLAPLAKFPRCVVHRDWFAGNLLWLPERTGVRRIGVIDFQDAAIGHPAYDLVSLLQDARQDLPEGLEAHALARYLALRPELEPGEFRTAYDVCAAQRHLRVACQWVRLALRDGRPHYLAHGPRTWRLLQAALAKPAAAPLAAALDRWIPAAARGNPPGLAA
jgi:tRNA threonylcarbamoyl adenosine modification protein YjeE